MDKQITFESTDSLGRCFAEAIDITYGGGGGINKIAGTTHPMIEAYLRDLKRDPRYQYVLMTPMGSHEFWGMNVNGDVFPEASLSFDLDRDDPIEVLRLLEAKWLRPFGGSVPIGSYKDFGYKTFLDALRYRHHVNKNPDIAYGDITLSVWNPGMQRVEVISRHDREKAKRVGAEDIIRDIDEGKPRQISMGCRVPFDVCTHCGHLSRTPRDYCSCLKMGMGSINADGSINGAVNFFPRFFDLSDVFVPAAKESGVLRKVASVRGIYVPQRKHASEKSAEIDKQVLPNVGQASIQQARDQEPDLPNTILEHGRMAPLLTTLAALGIILKPREFQRASLCRMGMHQYADALDQKRLVFQRSSAPATHSSFSPHEFSPHLADILSRIIPARSSFYPHLPQRIIRITVTRNPMRKEASAAPPSDVLTKIACAYSSYVAAFRDIPSLLDVAVRENPGYYTDHFFGELLTDTMSKTAGSLHAFNLDTPIVPTYVYCAYSGQASSPPPSWEISTPTYSPARALLTSVL